MDASTLVRDARRSAELSLRALAQAAGVATSTVHRIEKGELNPTVDVLARITEAAGMRLQVEARLDYAASVVGLARSIASDVADVADGDDRDRRSWLVRKAAELAAHFRRAGPADRLRIIAGRPPSTGDRRWDAFVAALAEWLAVQGGVPTPAWVHEPDRYLHEGWWVTPMASMRAWEYAGSPVSFQSRGVFLHRDSLTNV